GYLETYLTVGLVGLGLLLAAVIQGTAKLLRRTLDGGSYLAFRLAFVVAALIYNVTEAAFSGLAPIWFVLLLVVLDYPYRRNVVVDKKTGLPGEIKDDAETLGPNPKMRFQAQH
ncbi:MAG TPA: hypothetical protein VM260_02700, partial [Pirellula sp.]|nr:hypothetical protein [Pirellula sp.]